MREKMLQYIAAHPGCRSREIAGGIGVWLCDTEFLHMRHELEKEGLIYSKAYSDPAQMEFYDKWYIKI